MLNSMLDCYKIIQKIGQGGFCEIYQAEQTNLNNRRVAIKMLRDEYLNDKNMMGSYLVDQTEVIASLQHPNVVTIFDSGWEKDKYFVVMKYLSGKTLDTLLEEEYSLSVERTLFILKQLADAIDFAHRANIFHRDINPSNIIVDENDNVSLIGFKMKIPQGSIIGTPGYMSPEQIMNEKVGISTDIYSLGVLIFEMLTGKNPFQEGSLTEMFLRQVDFPPPSLYQANQLLPKEIDRVINRALNKDPLERFYHAKEFLFELEKAFILKQEQPTLITPQPISPTEIINKTTLENKIVSHILAIPSDKRPERNLLAEQKIKIKHRWIYQSVPKLRLQHPKEEIYEDFSIIGAVKQDDGEYLMLAEQEVLDKDQYLVFIKVLDKHTLQTIKPEMMVKSLGRIQSEVLESQGVSRTLLRSILGDIPEINSEIELTPLEVKPILINCFSCNKEVGHTEAICPHCGVFRLAPNCPQCGKPVTDWEDKQYFGSLNVYVWNSGWDGRCKHCGLEFETTIDLKTGHHWFERGPSSEIKIAGNESSTTVFLDFWQHLPTIEISINRLVPGGRLAKEEKFTLTLEEFEAISKQLQGQLQVLLQRKPWSEDTT